ncbi:MAG: DUF952 domain-containing protein [Ferruginibacter sp.]
MIYHIAIPAEWEAAQIPGAYAPAAFSREGFIHACKAEQAAGVLERYFRGSKNLLLLHIDESKLEAPLLYECAASVNDMFPHIYGKINISAVVKITFIEDQLNDIS